MKRPGHVCGVILLLLVPQGVAAQDFTEPRRQAITRALAFLRHAQQPDGSFLVYRCQGQAMADCLPVSATSPTAAVLAGLLEVEDPRTRVMVERGARFLLAQMDAAGFFSYFSRTGPTSATQPGELGVTCFVHMVLEPVGVPLPPILPKLMNYQTPEGTFYSFARPLAQRDDQATLAHADVIDSLANAWVLTYLARHGQVPTALCGYLADVAKEASGPPNPEFVESPYVFWYTLSQAYAHGATCLEPTTTALRSRLLSQQRPDGSWGSVIDTALAASSLMAFGYDGPAVDRAIQSLLQAQQPDGSWERVERWRSKTSSVQVVSEAVSSGYVLLALGQHLKTREALQL